MAAEASRMGPSLSGQTTTSNLRRPQTAAAVGKTERVSNTALAAPRSASFSRACTTLSLNPCTGLPTGLPPTDADKLNAMTKRFNDTFFAKRRSSVAHDMGAINTKESDDPLHIREIDDAIKADNSESCSKVMLHFKQLTKSGILSQGGKVFNYFLKVAALDEAKSTLTRMELAGDAILPLQVRLLYRCMEKRGDKALRYYPELLEKNTALPIDCHTAMFDFYLLHAQKSGEWEPLWKQFRFIFEMPKEEDQKKPIDIPSLLSALIACSREIKRYENIPTIFSYCKEKKMLPEIAQVLDFVSTLAATKEVSDTLLQTLTYITEEFIKNKRLPDGTKKTLYACVQITWDQILATKDKTKQQEYFREFKKALPSFPDIDKTPPERTSFSNTFDAETKSSKVKRKPSLIVSNPDIPSLLSSPKSKEKRRDSGTMT